MKLEKAIYLVNLLFSVCCYIVHITPVLSKSIFLLPIMPEFEKSSEVPMNIKHAHLFKDDYNKTFGTT